MLTTFALLASTIGFGNWLLTQEATPSATECSRIADEMLVSLKEEIGLTDLTSTCLDNRPGFTSASELNRKLLTYSPENGAFENIDMSLPVTRTITMVVTDGQVVVYQPQQVTSNEDVRDFVQVSYPTKVECDEKITSLPISVVRGLLKGRWHVSSGEGHNFYKTCVEDSGRWKFFIVDLTQK